MFGFDKILKRASVFVAAALFVFAAHDASASQAMRAPECFITGMVHSQEERTEEGKGMSDGETFYYLDMLITVTEGHYMDEADDEIFKGQEPPYSCLYDSAEPSVFQLRSYHPAKEVRDFRDHCIKAHSIFTADGNFMAGNWIYDIEVVPSEHCE